MASTRYALSLALLATALISSVSCQTTTGPIVDLGYAQYQGSVNATVNITNFLGIRYAAPPTGDLRWQPPQTPATVSGVQQADTEPNECIQSLPGIMDTNPFDNNTNAKRQIEYATEDCLFLNVHVPGELPTTRQFPVVVYIHGGGYVSGYAYNLNGEDLVRNSYHGVVAVVLQYRLGLFGFLAGSEVQANGVLNAGLLDQTFVLQWVQQYISLFGGDPSQVTVWGESAGAGSVIQHIVANGGNTQPPLFRAAMTSSTYLIPQYNYDDYIPQTLYNEVVESSGCSGETDTLACLRSVSETVLSSVNANINLNGFYGTIAFAPVVDGTFIVERPTQTIQSGQLNGEVYYAVTNQNEGTLFVNADYTMTFQQYVTEQFPYLTTDQINELTTLYAPLGNETVQADLATGESIFICPSYYLLEAFNNQSWKGEFALPPAYHADDLPYYWTSQGPTYKNQDFIQAFSQSFLEVVISLNPNDKLNKTNITPQWNTWAEGNTEMLFNETESGAPVVQTITTDPGLLQRCAYWLSIANTTHQ